MLAEKRSVGSYRVGLPGPEGPKPGLYRIMQLAICVAAVSVLRLAVRAVTPAVCAVTPAVCVAAVVSASAVATVSAPAAAAVISVPAVAAQEEAEDSTMFWSTTLKMIRAKFPGVAQLSTDSLQTWLDEPGQAPSGQTPSERPLLLDVREPEEYEVSHLRDAVPAPSREQALQALEGVSTDRPVVLYCSVGYRSSEVANYLAKKGFENVYNLEGSIFAWANEGRPVYRGGERAHVVHPYDRVWGKLLKKALRAKQAGGN